MATKDSASYELRSSGETHAPPATASALAAPHPGNSTSAPPPSVTERASGSSEEQPKKKSATTGFARPRPRKPENRFTPYCDTSGRGWTLSGPPDDCAARHFISIAWQPPHPKPSLVFGS